MSGERGRFVDGILDKAYEAIQHPESVSYLGQKLVDQVLTSLDSTVVANVRHDEITIPRTAKQDAIPFVAMYPKESLRLGNGFHTLTVTQLEAYTRVLSEWGPQKASFEDIIAAITEIGQAACYATEPGSILHAITRKVDVYVNSSGLVDDLGLRHGPILPVVKFMFRPLVILKMDHTEPDEACHEIAHADQIIRDPIRLFGSQLDLNMIELADEMPAFHVGAGASLGMRAGTPWIRQTNQSVQMAYDNVRAKHNAGKSDPFAPSELLLASYVGNRLGHILHSVENYEAIAKSLRVT